MKTRGIDCYVMEKRGNFPGREETLVEMRKLIEASGDLTGLL